MSQFKLIQEILSMSVSKDWDSAKSEWKLVEIMESEQPETCLCGHYPIIELCELINTANNNIAVVGNHCVKKFFGLSSEKIFSSIKRLRIDLKKSANMETIRFLYQKKMLSEWEYNFYGSTFRKNKLSESQLDKRIQINKKIILNIKKYGIK